MTIPTQLKQARQYQYLPMLELAPSDPRITDDQLVNQIMIVARMSYFMEINAERGKEIYPITMRNNYGLLLCTEEIAPLAEQARVRANMRGGPCHEFVSALDQIKASYQGLDKRDQTVLINCLSQFQVRIRSKPIDILGDLSEWTSPARTTLASAAVLGKLNLVPVPA